MVNNKEHSIPSPSLRVWLPVSDTIVLQKSPLYYTRHIAEDLAVRYATRRGCMGDHSKRSAISNSMRYGDIHKAAKGIPDRCEY